METKQTQIRLPLETLKIAEKLVRLEKGMDISKALRYFIYRGMQDFKIKGTAGLEPFAREAGISKYINFLDTVESTKANDYIPGMMPTIADQQKQEEYLNALSE